MYKTIYRIADLKLTRAAILGNTRQSVSGIISPREYFLSVGKEEVISTSIGHKKRSRRW